MRSDRRLRLALVGALVGIAVPLAAPATAAEHKGAPAGVVIPVGPDGVSYRASQGPDDGPLLGPPALAVSPDGTMWIDDVYANRVLRYAPDGTRLAPVDLAARDVRAAMDIAVDADELFVLDVDPGLDRYRVLRLTHAGRVLSSHDLPAGHSLDDGLSGIAIDGDGSLLVELAGGSKLLQLLDPAGRERLVERHGYRVDGRRYAVEHSGTRWGPVTVLAGGVRVEIDADHGNGAVQFLGAAPNGDFFVSVEDVHLGAGPIRVDLTVHRYSSAGRFVSAARRDLRAQATHVPHPFALLGDQVLELSTAQDHVRVAAMDPESSSEPGLPPVPVRRYTAVDGVEAALVLSRAAFPGGARTALLARSDEVADSLATGGTQAQLGAPLLLTPGDRLDADVARELVRLGVRTVRLLGGPAALSNDVELALRAAGMATRRVAGRDRVQTAVAVARADFPTAPVALLARGDAGTEPTRGFADALAVGAWAADRRWPTLLTPTDRLPAAVLGYLRAAGTRKVHVVGGPAAVGEDVLVALRRSGFSVTRVAGADRAATAVQVARQRGAGTARAAGQVLLLDGTRADAWASGVAIAASAGQTGAQVVLGAPRGLPVATARWLQTASAPPPLLCAPLVSRSTCDLAAAALGHRKR